MSMERFWPSADTSPRASHPSERIKTQLRKALAREKALLRQMDRLIQQQSALSELIGSPKDAASRLARLTPREREIMQLILAGSLNKNIAADIGISCRTVEGHRASIIKKTGAKSLPALVRLALAAAWNIAPDRTLRLELSQPPRPPKSYETKPSASIGAAA